MGINKSKVDCIVINKNRFRNHSIDLVQNRRKNRWIRHKRVVNKDIVYHSRMNRKKRRLVIEIVFHASK